MPSQKGTKAAALHAFFFKRYNHKKSGKFRLSFELIGDGSELVKDEVFEYQITHGAPEKLIVTKAEPVDSAEQLPRKKKYSREPRDGVFRKGCYQIGKQLHVVLQFTDSYGNFCCTGKKCCMGRETKWTLEVSLSPHLRGFYYTHCSWLPPLRMSHSIIVSVTFSYTPFSASVT